MNIDAINKKLANLRGRAFGEYSARLLEKYKALNIYSPVALWYFVPNADVISFSIKVMNAEDAFSKNPNLEESLLSIFWEAFED
jgi:hypothetical protein